MASTKVCGCCATSKNLTQYYKSPVDGKYVPICKNCCKKKYKEFLQITNKDSAALWLILAQLGIPFIYDIWKQTELIVAKSGINFDVTMSYIKTLT